MLPILAAPPWPARPRPRETICLSSLSPRFKGFENGLLVSEMQTRIGRIMCETEAQHRNFQSRLRRLRLDRSGVVDGQRTCRLCGALPSSRARPSPKAQDARRRCKPLKSCSRYAGGAGLAAQSEQLKVRARLEQRANSRICVYGSAEH